MTRLRTIAAIFAASAIATTCGCAGTWDKVSSQKFRDNPFKSTFYPAEDPMTVLRTKVDGNERADAMRRLTEPAADGKSAQEQDEALQALATAATSDPSPIVRCAAIDALGRFADPRAVKILIAAYHQADGAPTEPTKGGVMQAGRFDPLAGMGPVGFEPVFTTTLRSRAATALASTKQPEAVTFLASVAAGSGVDENGQPTTDRDVRSAAVRGLGRVRSKESVAALSRILKDESGRDVVLAHNAHAGLKDLTGKNIPADPAEWEKVVQAGVEVQPEPNLLQRAAGWVGK